MSKDSNRLPGTALMRWPRWRVLALTALACLALLATLAGFEWRSRAAALADVQQQSDNLAAAVLQQSAEVVRQADFAIGMVRRAQQLDGRSPAVAVSVREVVAAEVELQPTVIGIAIYDAEGRLTSSSLEPDAAPPSGTDLDFFREACSVAADHLHVGAPLRVSLAGEWFLPVARRLSERDGSFAGVVMVAVRLQALQDQFARLALSDNGLVTLMSRGGTVLVRRPFVLQAMGLSMAQISFWQQHVVARSAGSFTNTSPVDGIERHMSFVHHPEFPLLAIVGVPPTLALAHWREQALRHAAVTGLFMLLLVLAGWRIQRDMTRQQRLAAELQRSMTHLHDLQHAIDEHAAVDVTDGEGTILRVNDRLCRLTQYGPDELRGRNLTVLDSGRHPDAFHRAMRQTLIAGQVWKGEMRCRAKDGSHLWLDTTIVPFQTDVKQPAHFIAIRTDVTARKQADQAIRQAHQEAAAANEQLARLAAFDELTGLPNRRHFNDTMAAELKRAQRVHQPLAVLMVDVDHFKPFNDTYGHGAGDECLRHVATAARKVQRRPSDLAARWGGEEFVLLLPSTGAEGALAVARLLCSSIEAMALAHSSSPRGHVTVSIGVYAAIPALQTRPEELLEMADRALYQAKQGGRNRACLYERELPVSTELDGVAA
ncbi:diguanylate cyclase domain-containing protein [Azohydromonas aeria]|uniref:diguanylate cyclase domain-containing protein n=1 Tax=Azohydromonas aeria TaxID=2590212 RepID=UPI0018DFDF30|nr:diguanylate cyclase [Azohydromonas aeria]